MSRLLSKPLSLNAWLNFLENRHAQVIQLGLERVKEVARRLDILNPLAKVITVAGTNGKGTTVASLEAIYAEGGYQVGSYTSPHLLRFNERIKLNQRLIDDQVLCEAFSLIEEARQDLNLTYFEVTTLAALWCFKQVPLDLIILEVGLGGRLDATNIVDADLAIITTIDYDHQEFLGSSKEEIGFQKAGILRPHAPFIYADKNPPQSVLNEAKALQCPIYVNSFNYSYSFQQNRLDFIYGQKKLSMALSSPLHPNSLSAAIMAGLSEKLDLPLCQEHIIDGLSKVEIPGRLQLIKGPFSTLLDVSHNLQSVGYLAGFIKQLRPKGKVRAVFGALKDKDIPGMIACLKEQINEWYPACLTGLRAVSSEVFNTAFAVCGIIGFSCYASPLEAYQTACAQADKNDLIIVFGSFATVSPVMEYLHSKSFLYI